MSLQAFRARNLDYAVLPASYIVFKENNRTYVKNGRTGQIEYSSDDDSEAIQYPINRIYKLGGGRLLIKSGMYYPTKTNDLPDGIKIVIDAEPGAVFRYTGQFYLFKHVPSSPTWTSEIIIRGVTVDRRGSGDRNNNVFAVNYAKTLVYEDITVYDDWRGSHGDAALLGYNNIYVLVQRCRVYNKSYGIWVFGHHVVVRDNYVENTAYVGIAAAGLLSGFPVPPGYQYGGLVVIEDNTCVDCGRTDEAISIDYQSGTENVTKYGLGIIRNNRIVAVNHDINFGITVFNPIHRVIIENNEVDTLTYGRGIKRAIFVVYADTIIRNNKIRVLPASPTDPIVYVLGSADFVENVVEAGSSRGIEVDLIGGYRSTVRVADNDISGCELAINVYAGDTVIIVFKGNRAPNPPLLAIHSNTTIYAHYEENGLLPISIDAGKSATVVMLSGKAYILPDSPGKNVAIKYPANGGTTTIPSGSTRVTVQHGLLQAPSKVLITPLGAPPGKLWVENITSTSFDIVTDTPPSSDLKVAWYAEI